MAAKGGPMTAPGNPDNKHGISQPYNEDTQTQLAAKSTENKNKDKITTIKIRYKIIGVNKNIEKSINFYLSLSIRLANANRFLFIHHLCNMIHKIFSRLKIKSFSSCLFFLPLLKTS